MIDCASDTATLIGDDLGALNAKYGSPVVVPYDSTVPASKVSALDDYSVVIMFPPLNSRCVLGLNPATMQTALLGDDLGRVHFKYDGACLGGDGAMYCAPSCALQMMRVELVVTTIAPKIVEGDENADEDNDEEEEPVPTDPITKRKSSSPPRKGGSVPRTSKKKGPTSKGDKKDIILGISLDDSGSKGKKDATSTDVPSNATPTSKLAFISPFMKVKKALKGAKPQLFKSASSLYKTKYVWPPNVYVCFLGAERTGQFKYGCTVLSADGRTAIGVPLNVMFCKLLLSPSFFPFSFSHSRCLSLVS
jgi:hypothetical protein